MGSVGWGQVQEPGRFGDLEGGEDVALDRGEFGALVGVTALPVGRAMLDALIDGERDPAALADLAKRRLRSKIPALTEALTGRFGEHHAFLADCTWT